MSKRNPSGKTDLKAKVYRLTRNRAPVSFILASRDTQSKRLLYFDEDKKTNRALRYARNQSSPFVDEQDSNPILEPIIFEEGFLTVPRENVVLQRFLDLHPDNGVVFEERDPSKEAEKQLDKMDLEMAAMNAVSALDVERMEEIARVALRTNVETMTTKEIKRDLLVFARANPEQILKLIDDPGTSLKAKVALFFDKKLLTTQNNGREVCFNLENNKARLMTVPPGENRNVIVAEFLEAEQGKSTLKMLNKYLELT